MLKDWNCTYEQNTQTEQCWSNKNHGFLSCCHLLPLYIPHCNEMNLFDSSQGGYKAFNLLEYNRSQVKLINKLRWSTPILQLFHQNMLSGVIICFLTVTMKGGKFSGSRICPIHLYGHTWTYASYVNCTSPNEPTGLANTNRRQCLELTYRGQMPPAEYSGPFIGTTASPHKDLG